MGKLAGTLVLLVCLGGSDTGDESITRLMLSTAAKARSLGDFLTFAERTFIEEAVEWKVRHPATDKLLLFKKPRGRVTAQEESLELTAELYSKADAAWFEETVGTLDSQGFEPSAALQMATAIWLDRHFWHPDARVEGNLLTFNLPDKREVIAIADKFALVIVECDVPGADVEVEGATGFDRKEGKGFLPPGKITIIVRAPGHKPHTSHEVVELKTVNRFKYRLQRE